jgi:hypothetical protein
MISGGITTIFVSWTHTKETLSDTTKSLIRACLGISGMKGNEGHWGGEISIISQNFSKSPSILHFPNKP